MFVPHQSSLTAPAARVTRQTTLDAHRQPHSKVAKKDIDTETGVSGMLKGRAKDKDAPQCRVVNDHPPEDEASSSDDGPRSMPCDANEARSLLEEEGTLDP